jgi:hypothetical protein
MEVSMNPKRTALAALCTVALCGAAQAAQMTIYKQPQFRGERVTVNDTARDLQPLGITDQASSLVVRGGSWEACTQPDFNGDCRTLEPGEYATLDTALNHRIESVRQLEPQARDRDRYAHRGSREDERAYNPPVNDGWAYGDRDRSQGDEPWRR